MIENIEVLLKSYFKMVRDIKKIRKKESAYLEYLVKNLHKLSSRFFSRKLEGVRKKVYLNFFAEEIILKRAASFHQQETSIVQVIEKLLRTERRKEAGIKAAATAAWLTPLFGTLLTFSILKMGYYLNDLLSINQELLNAYAK